MSKLVRLPSGFVFDVDDVVICAPTMEPVQGYLDALLMSRSPSPEDVAVSLATHDVVYLHLRSRPDSLRFLEADARMLEAWSRTITLLVPGMPP